MHVIIYLFIHLFDCDIKQIGTSDVADDAWCMGTLFTLHKSVLNTVRGSVLVK
jgi:hypothetical protein